MNSVIQILAAIVMSLLISCGVEEIHNEPSKVELNKKKIAYTSGQPVFENKEVIKINFELAPKDYVNWVNQKKGTNQLIKSKRIGEFEYSMKYLPIDYMICNELKQIEISKTELDSLRIEYQGMEYYELRIAIDGFTGETAKYDVQNMVEYQERIVYMSFVMQDHLNVEINGQFIPCRLFHFERTYGVAPYAKFLLGFSKAEMGDSVLERTIVFDDNLFNKGLLKFNWQSSEIANIPKIQVI